MTTIPTNPTTIVDTIVKSPAPGRVASEVVEVAAGAPLREDVELAVRDADPEVPVEVAEVEVLVLGYKRELV